MRYQKYELQKEAAYALNYIDGMTDRAYGCLPFWLTMPHKKPAEAEHCRVDDAELVGSWFEAVDSLRQILGDSDTTRELYNGFREKLLLSWGDKGLRYSEPYPWTHTIHASFHEMGYILPALNRLVKNNPGDKEAEEKASALIRGMRSLVIERKVRTFWSGDREEKAPIYEFPNDVYLADGGFDLTRHTGRGEQCIRNAVMLHALVDRYTIAGDEVALDLAKGLANHLLGPSRYFNYKYEFFGHVHSSLWVAAGLIYLSRVTGEERYLHAGEEIYRYVRSMGSSFGWIPEYAQWKAPSEEHCETCCIKDLILCCEELILCGHDEYWDDMNRFGRNQLSENQIRYTGYIVSEDKPDENGHTFRNLENRLFGGYTGGSEPNSISLTRFRSIAGCCVGTAPIALNILWRNVVRDETVGDETVSVVNIVTDKETDEYALSSMLPDEGVIMLRAKKAGNYGFRLYDWMAGAELSRNGKTVKGERSGVIIYTSLDEGDTLCVTFPVETVEREEAFAGAVYRGFWRGADMIDLLPHGGHIRLYQRDNAQPKVYPTSEEIEWTGVADRGPTQQKTIK